MFVLFHAGLDDIELFYYLKRYFHCIKYCSFFIDKSLYKCGYDKMKAQLYRAMSMYHVYNCELMERIEKQKQMPGFEYKDMMRNFCKSHILQVIKTLAYVKQNAGRQALEDNTTQDLFNNETTYMLDKALLDYLAYNTKEVSICLLCHSKAQKLVHSHYIPKAILQEFVKALGVDSGESVFFFSPTEHPSNWQLQSAAKVTFSMLCKACDGTLLSKDENLFKANVFNIVYQPNSPGSFLEEHSITYTQYLYRFAVGLLFRNIATCYSSVYAEIGETRNLHSVMQSCREVLLNLPSSSRPKIYMLALPLQLPSSLPQIYGWKKYVLMTNSPYAAYKLLRYEEPMIPKGLYCFMVKIGAILFILSLDADFDKELKKTSSSFEILSSGVDTECNFRITIPANSDRSRYISQKLWWSLLGWAKKEINMAASINLSVKQPTKVSQKFPDGAWIKDLLDSVASQPVLANLLPPGFELNFEKFNTLPEKVIVVPNGHAVLLHSSFKATLNAKCYAVIAKKVSNTERTSKAKPSLYSLKTQPYILVCLQDVSKKLVIKVGFFIDDKSLQVIENLPGVSASMKESLQLKELIEQVPDIVCAVLRKKGFTSLVSLLLWQESFNDEKSDK